MVGWIILVAIIVLVIVLFARTAANRPREAKGLGLPPYPDAQGAAERLAGAINFATLSYFDRSKMDLGEFEKLHEYLAVQYPLVHQHLKKEVTDFKSLIYYWEGRDSELEPIALLAHQDVVPVNRDLWTHDPFVGTIEDGYVYGRGALDMKGQLIAVLESVESLLREGFAPARPVYLLFGSDEEPMGDYGAKKISELLEQRGVRLHFVLDEGGAIQDGRMMGVDGMVALVGICEKGILNLRLTAKGASGHASMPPKVTAVGALAKAITAIENHQMQPEWNYATRHMFRALSPHMGGAFRLLFSNLWLFSGLIKKVLSGGRASAALVRTTFAPTMLDASNAPNVLAGSASCVFNIRVAPGKTDRDVLAHVERNAPDIAREVIYYYPPSPVSSVETEAFAQVMQAVRDAFPDMAAAPYPVVAATDSRHYYNICDNVFRFVPFPSIAQDIGTVHGEDERISIDSLGQGIAFYRRVLTGLR